MQANKLTGGRIGRSLMEKAHDFADEAMGVHTDAEALRAFEAYVMTKTDPRVCL